VAESAPNVKTAGFLGFAAAAIASSIGVYACNDGTSSPPIVYTQLLQNLTDDTATPTTARFANQADALVSSLNALETSADAATLRAAQAAWRSARHAYRLLDAMHYGPKAELETSDRIDTFPADVSAIATLASAAAPPLSGAANNAKGFLALEALLFSEAGDGAALEALAEPKKRALARSMGEDIAGAAHQLADAWSFGFASQLKTAGNGSTRYATERAAVDDLVGAVSYAFEIVVAVELANPLGRKNAGRPDQSQIIARISDNAITDMLSTLAGIRATYDGRGFTTLVRTRSASLDDAFHAQLAACEDKLKALPPPFSQALLYRTSAVLDAYDTCKTAKATWNVEVTSALGATMKPADNDGD
jgi:predicted lipoprotein